MALLDWLIPSQVQRDIQSYGRRPKTIDTMLTKEQFGEKYKGGSMSPWGILSGTEKYYFDVPEEFYGSDYAPTSGSGRGGYKTPGGTKLAGTKTKRGWEYEAKDYETALGRAYEDYEAQHARNLAAEAEMAPYSTLDPFSSESILSGLGGGAGETYLGQQYDLGPLAEGTIPTSGIGQAPELSPEMIRSLNPGDFRKLHTGAYQPFIERERGLAERQHAGRMSQAAGVGGGFAGYGRRDVAREAAEGSFLAASGDVLGEVGQKRAAGLQNIYDIMSGWGDIQSQYEG